MARSRLRPVRRDQRLLRLLAAALALAVLHAQHALIALAVEVPEDVLVVDLAGAGLLAPGIVADVERRDLVPGPVDVGDEVALGDLLVVQVVDDLDRGAVDGLADLIGLRDLLEEQARMVGPPVQGLDHDDQAGRLGDLGTGLEVVDQVGRLIVPLQLLAVQAPAISRAHLALARLATSTASWVVLTMAWRTSLSGVTSVGFFPLGVHDERPQGHAEPGHLLADPLLEVLGLAAQAVVEHGREALVRANLIVLDGVVAGMRLEGAKSGAYLSLNFPAEADAGACVWAPTSLDTAETAAVVAAVTRKVLRSIASSPWHGLTSCFELASMTETHPHRAAQRAPDWLPMILPIPDPVKPGTAYKNRGRTTGPCTDKLENCKFIA